MGCLKEFLKEEKINNQGPPALLVSVVLDYSGDSYH